jgi:hypothetical protein
MLGMRCLWVDSLCIVQNTVDKHDQVQQIDRIYQEAMLCVVAATGGNANAGLPGISADRDVRQRSIEVDGIKLANTLPSMLASVGASIWASRGWCFQEGMLSSRKLIVTRDQTYYHCPHSECGDTRTLIHTENP